MKMLEFDEKTHDNDMKLKRSKTSWMGHGAWMGITWENMEDGHIGLKHSSQNITCFDGDMFWGFGLLKH
jgi:hypothetical protein